MSKPIRSSCVGCCDRLLAGLSKGMVVTAMLFLVAMTILITIQVISRNIFNIGLPWADELARFTGLVTVFFTIPFLQYKGRHISVDIFSSRLVGRAATILRTANEVIVLIFCLLLLIAFARFFESAAYFSTPAVGIPNWFYYAPALVGMFVCTLVSLLRVVHLVQGSGTTAMDGSNPGIDEERKP